jgi:hypothetical protein
MNIRETLDVLRQGVPMLRSFGETAQNECYGTGVTPKPCKLINHEDQTSPSNGIPSRRLATVSPPSPGVLRSRRTDAWQVCKPEAFHPSVYAMTLLTGQRQIVDAALRVSPD